MGDLPGFVSESQTKAIDYDSTNVEFSASRPFPDSLFFDIIYLL